MNVVQIRACRVAAALAWLSFALPARAEFDVVPSQPIPEVTPEPPPPAQPAGTTAKSADGADASSRFGARGQLVLSADLLFSLGAAWSSNDPRKRSYFTAAPSFDVFVTDNISLGAFVEYRLRQQRDIALDGALYDFKDTTAGLGATLGLNAPMGRWLSFWLRLSAGWSTTHSVAQAANVSDGIPAGAGYDYTQTGLYVLVQAPLLVHPTPNWFLGVGPTLYHDLSRHFDNTDATNERTTIGFAYTVGGYLPVF